MSGSGSDDIQNDELEELNLPSRPECDNHDNWWIEFNNASGMQLYSFDELPGKDSALVADCITNFEENGLYDISGIGEPFKELNSALETIQNVAIAKGLYQLENKVRDLGDNVSELCTESGNVLCKFAVSSENTYRKFNLTFCYLRDGNEKIACKHLENILKITKDTEAFSKKLDPLIDKCTAGIKDVLGSVEKEKENFKEVEAKKEEVEAEIRKVGEDQCCVREQIEAKDSQLVSLKKHNWISEGVGALLKVGTAVLRLFALPTPARVFQGAIDVVDTGRAAIASVTADKDDEKNVKRQMVELEKADFEMNRKKAELAVDWEQLLKKEQVSTELEPLLHELSGKMRKVRERLRFARLFWERLHTVISPTSDRDGLQAIVGGLPTDEAERIAFWGSKSFATDAILMYARWVARQVICNRSGREIDEASKHLTELICANPTKAEAMEWLTRRNDQVRSIEDDQEETL